MVSDPPGSISLDSMNPRRIPLSGALLLALGGALALALLPAGVALDRKIAAELRRVAVEDLGRAPMILSDRNAARAEALSMHAMAVAATDGLGDALAAGRFDVASGLATVAASQFGEDAVLVAPDGAIVLGPELPDETLAALRAGEGRVDYVFHDGAPRAVALVAVQMDGGWMGAAGSSSVLGESLAVTLAALSQADVTVLGPTGEIVASTLDSLRAGLVVSRWMDAPAGTTDGVVELEAGGDRYWVAEGGLGPAGDVLFSRSARDALRALPGLRRGALLAWILTLLAAMGIGAVVAVMLTRPVRALAVASRRLADGDFDAPTAPSRIRELHQLGESFHDMRDSLRRRVAELAEANRALADRQERLQTLQAELIQRDRLAASGRMAAELAHEIRNPVANVRNCLEVVRRSVDEGSEGMKFADLAIDELLRMHEMAEHLLDLNRPLDPTASTCGVAAVVAQVAALAGVGSGNVRVTVTGAIPERLEAAIAPDALKQVLFNIVENAIEASPPDGEVAVRVDSSDDDVAVEVTDEGPGIAQDVLASVFDPFFTTKGAAHGVGLGLSVAEGLVRRGGGTIHAGNRDGARGAVFTVRLRRVPDGGARR